MNSWQYSSCPKTYRKYIWKIQKSYVFFRNMASVHALPLPGRYPTNKDEQYLLLPCDITKAYVYRKYGDACTEEHTIPFQRRMFETAWNEILPYIVTARPARGPETLESETIVSYCSQDAVTSAKKARKCTLCGICGHNKKTSTFK